jgi:hypothetical protein
MPLAATLEEDSTEDRERRDREEEELNDADDVFPFKFELLLSEN